MDELFLNCMLSNNTIVGGRGWLKKFIKTFLKIHLLNKEFFIRIQDFREPGFCLIDK